MTEEQKHHMVKGTLYLMTAQIIFMGSGYIIHFGIARMVSAEEYGRFGVVLAILQVIQIFLVKGVPDAVTKYVAEGRDTIQTKRRALKLQTSFSLIISLGLFSLAPLIADKLNDERLTLYIMVISSIIPIRAILSVYTGYLNGLRDFKKVSLIFNANTFSRILLVFLFLAIGFGILGAIGGYIAASVIALTLSYVYSKVNIAGKSISSKKIIDFAIPMILFSACYLALMNLDLFFVKAIVENPEDAGYYTASKMLSSIIFGAIVGLSLTLFPSISKSVSKNDLSQTQSYISNSIRYLIMILLPLCVIISIYARAFLTLFYPEEYAAGSTSLSLLVFGTSFIALFVIFGTIISGAGHPRTPTIIGVFLVIVDIILNYVLVDRYGMSGGAWSTFIAGGMGIILSGGVVYKMFKTIVRWQSFLKISVATAIIGFLSHVVNISGPLLAIWSGVLFVVYFGILCSIKEIKKEDVVLVKGIFNISVR